MITVRGLLITLGLTSILGGVSAFTSPTGSPAAGVGLVLLGLALLSAVILPSIAASRARKRAKQ